MGFHVKHIHKYIRWLRGHRERYQENCKVSKEYARRCGDLDWALLLQLPQDKMNAVAERKHEWVLEFMEKACCETIEKYKVALGGVHKEQFCAPVEDIRVWSMWWQGEEQADKLFRMCIDSARRHTHQDVITLDKDNYTQYFTIPEHILRKHREGKIALQHVCDLMVMSILAAQGGVFTGATVWWSQDVDEEFLRSPFYVCRAVTDSRINMSRSRWVGYFLAGRKDFPLFSFVRDCLHEYWDKCDRAVDYLMMDYIFELAYRHIPCIRETIDALPEKNNMLRNELIERLAEPYEEEAFARYTQGDTFLYKLSWKFGAKDEVTADGRMTNYGHILAECGEGVCNG